MKTFPKFTELLRPQIIPVLTFGLMTFVSWRSWTSLITDSGREMDLPLRLLKGEMLYRDIHFTYPPFSPYFNALLYRIFGVHLDTLNASGFALSIILSVLCYKIARRLLPPLESSFATSIVILLLVFKPFGNLILPYSFSAYHATIFSIFTLFFILRYSDSYKKRELIISGIFAGLALITKHEFALAAIVTICISLVYLHGKRFKKLIADLFLAGGAAALVSVPVYGLLFYLIDSHTLIVDCHLFYTHIPKSLVLFNQYRSGFNYPLLSALQMFGGFTISVGILSVVVLISDKTKKLRLTAAVAFLISLGATALIFFLTYPSWQGSPLRGLPIFLSIFIIWGWFQGARKNLASDSKELSNAPSISLFIISVYSLAVLFRVLLRVPAGGFSGAFFIPISIVLIIYVITFWLPNALKNWSGDDASGKRAALIGRGICVFAIFSMFGIFTSRYFSKYDYRIDAARGSVVVSERTGKPIDQALRYIEANTQPGDFISVLPEGSDLAFLTRRRINLRHQVFIPDFLSVEDELRAIGKLKEKKVKYIFLINRRMSEFGKDNFGRDFYTTLFNWIEQNYVVDEVIGVSGEKSIEIGDARYFIKVYKLK